MHKINLPPRFIASPPPPIPPEYLRCAVPVQMGGLGGDTEELGLLMRALCRESLSAGVLFWCQRMAIEFLVQSFNVAVREHLLPELLSFQRAASTPLSLDVSVLMAKYEGRDMRLRGEIHSIANASANGFTLIVPVQMQSVTGWAVLRSEEDGVYVEPGNLLPHLKNTCPARVRIENAFFRSDEWLGDSLLLHKTEPARLALGVLYQSLLSAPEMIL